MRDLHKEFVYRKIKRPNKLLASVVQRAFRVLSKQRHVEFVYDEDYGIWTISGRNIASGISALSFSMRALMRASST